MLKTILIIAITVIAIFYLFQWFIIRKSKKLIGHKINLDKFKPDFAKKLNNKKIYLYFYNPSCSVCKTQTPIVEELKKENINIESIDATKDFDLANFFKIKAVPSIILNENNEVKQYLIGINSKEKLLNLYQAN
ncbi:MAG TPA: thioredoxin family protein [Ignavibacteriales bacterium]|mgnify:CR=1 FL=1|nr:thioredoxin family protein [Ignavibacteriales bacterium]